MLIYGSVLRAIIATIYLLIICVSTSLTFIFYSEPVLFAFVITAVSLLILSYPILCLFTVTRAYDLELAGCRMEWIKNSESFGIPVKCEEKSTRLDEAFVYAYM